MKKLLILPVLALICSVNANAGFWDTLGKVNQVLGTINGATSTSTTGTNSSSTSRYQTAPLAQITPAQEQRISQIIKANTNDKFLNQAILKAKPNIEGLLRLASCQNNDSVFLMAGRYKSPSSTGLMYSVMPTMKYHPLNQCLTVQSVGNWSMPLRDTLKFTAVYASEVSPESTKMHIDMKCEPDGQWYVTTHMHID